MATKHVTYPIRPYVGVDCSGQPNSPPVIAVATRFSRRNREVKWVVKVTRQRIMMYSKAHRDWQEKVYAAAFFRVLDKVFRERYEIHIDHELPNFKSQKKVEAYLQRLFGLVHAREILKQHPSICFKTKELSEYVREADRKATLAHDRKMNLDEKDASLDYLMKLLSN